MVSVLTKKIYLTSLNVFTEPILHVPKPEVMDMVWAYQLRNELLRHTEALFQ